eukprot:4677617-Prymnesium_polylepis.1
MGEPHTWTMPARMDEAAVELLRVQESNRFHDDVACVHGGVVFSITPPFQRVFFASALAVQAITGTSSRGPLGLGPAHSAQSPPAGTGVPERGGSAKSRT